MTKKKNISLFKHPARPAIHHQIGNTMKSLLALGFLVIPLHANEAKSDPANTWELTVESGYLWNIGHNTEINYEIIPTQLTLRSPIVWTLWEDEKGAKIVIRNRFSALFETITVGPESHYIGLAGAPSIEYWFPSRETSLYFSIGGGFGWTDSSGGPQGLGQDFIFNWFTQFGIRQKISEQISLLAGPYFIHHSDLGMTDPNPGIDAFGFTLGCAWTF